MTFTLGIAMLSGCAGRDKVSPADYLPQADEAINAFGLTIDENATPQLVVWSFLMAIRDDITAGNDSDKRDQALRLQCALTDLQFQRDGIKNSPVKRVGLTVDEVVLRKIRNWAPMLAYYHDAVPSNAADAQQFMNVRMIETQPPQCLVLYTIPKTRIGSQSGDEYGVTIRMSLAKSAAGFWRIRNVGFGRSPDFDAITASSAQE